MFSAIFSTLTELKLPHIIETTPKCDYLTGEAVMTTTGGRNGPFTKLTA